MPSVRRSMRRSIQRRTLVQSTDVGSSVSYEVEAILAHSYTSPGKPVHYCIKWKNFPATANTWEPESSLNNCKEILTNYWNEEFRQGSQGKKNSQKSAVRSESVQHRYQRRSVQPAASKKTAASKRGASIYAVADSTTADSDHQSAVTRSRSASAGLPGQTRDAKGNVVYNGEHWGNGTKSHDDLNPGDELHAYEAGDILLTLYDDKEENVREFMGVIDPDDSDVELMVPVDMIYSGNWALDPACALADNYSPYDPIPVVPVKGGPLTRK